jgi:tight adherence protein B
MIISCAAIAIIGLSVLIYIFTSPRRSVQRYNQIRRAYAGGRRELTSRIQHTVQRSETHVLLSRRLSDLSSLIPRYQTLKSALLRAGLKISVVEFVICCVALWILVTITGLLEHMGTFVSGVIGLLAGVILPWQLVGWRTRSMLQQFRKEFPACLDLVVRVKRFGLPIAEAIHVTFLEIKGTVGSIFSNITSDIRLGMALEEALWNSAKRVNIQEFNFFAISLSVQQETGGNVGDVLQGLSNIMRRREQLRLKIRALSSEARASALIIGALPFLMFFLIYLVTREYALLFFLISED